MASADPSELAEIARQRSAATAAIVASSASHRLVVSGPGTGKTFTFQEALRAAGNNGLALSFIRNLVADLSVALDGQAQAFTLHGYCKHLMHHHNVAGLRLGDYYPALPELVLDDIHILDGDVIDAGSMAFHFHDLDDSGGLVSRFLARADYYLAVSHNDLVYRILKHFEANPAAVPAFPLVVVDEYQDFSRLETTFIALLATRSPVLIAGDDDQALYGSLKHASPDFIRELAHGGEFENFVLPFCSRCTSVVVAAVNAVIAVAVARGNLRDRLDKPFSCFLPDKGADSDANPKIVHVQCSTANTDYAGKYVTQQIGAIPAADIARSRAGKYPTALVIGSNPFLDRSYEVVRESFPQARMKRSAPVSVDAIDGYRRIAADERSRLGWRIVLAVYPFEGSQALLKQVLENDSELVDDLPGDYVVEHGAVAQLIGALREGLPLSDDEEARLTVALGRSIEEIRSAAGIAEIDDVGDDDTGFNQDLEEGRPDILFTTLVGSKGLSAEHVFIVGLNDGHLPKRRESPTDAEICRFIVALSRTRVRCHLISFSFFGKGPLKKPLP